MPYSPHNARVVAITSALEPPRPTPRGIVVVHRTAVKSASGATSRAQRRTVASTSALGGATDGAAARRACARAAKFGTVVASTAPPYPSEGLPASAARASAWASAEGSHTGIEQCRRLRAQRSADAGVVERVLEEHRAVALDRTDVVTRNRDHRATQGPARTCASASPRCDSFCAPRRPASDSVNRRLEARVRSTLNHVYPRRHALRRAVSA